MHLDDTAAVSHGDLELVTINFNAFTARGKVAESLHHQTANGIHFIITEAGTKYLVKILDRRKRT